MTPFELLTTTRAVRRRLDLTQPVEVRLVLDCIEVALQAPTARGRWLVEWLVLNDAGLRASAADVYRTALAESGPSRVGDSLFDDVKYLADHLERVPLLVLPFTRERPSPDSPYVRQVSHWASVIPAIWSFQLALRSCGLATTYTTVHLRREQEMHEALRLPPEICQLGLLPVAHLLGQKLRRAPRPSVDQVTHIDIVRASKSSGGSA